MRFLFALLVAVALVSGYYAYQKDQREHEESYWMRLCRDQLGHFTPSGATKSLKPDESSFFKLILVVKKAKDAGVDVDKMISDTCSELAIDSSSDLVHQSLMESYNTAKKFKVFDDPTSLMNLEHGETTLITTAEWRGEKLAVVQLIPPWLAPEVAQSVPNLALVPAIVRDAWGTNITGDLYDHARKFYSRHIITKESYERINSFKESAKPKP